MRRAPARPTDADLRAAWARRRRDDWPATYEAAMADPLLRQLVRCVAIGSLLARQHPARSPARPATWRRAPTTDGKRLAAGGRDDD